MKGSAVRSRILSVISIVAAILGAACADEIATAPILPAPVLNTTVSVLPAVLPGDSAAADSLGRALALALSDDAARRQILEDLRDSPFPRHKIHLPSYLRGRRGGALVAKMAAISGIASARLVQMADIRGGLQVAMQRSPDRMFWMGTPDIAVKGTPFTLAERNAAYRARGSAQNAYTIAGEPRRHGPFTESLYPYLVVSPIDVSFGAHPELERAAARRNLRQTISSFEEEIVSYRQRGDSATRSRQARREPITLDDPCVIDPAGAPSLMTHDPECIPDDGSGGGDPSRPMGVALPSGKTFDSCYQPGAFDASIDRDQDGVDDGCEAELAVAFRPQLVLMADDCDTRRAPYFASRYKWSNDWGDVILVFYAISYVYDCGPPFSCGNDIPTCDTHAGDSEWIIVEVGRYADPARPWALKYATLSAHWKSDNDQTRGYRASSLEDAEGSPGFGAPRIWVSEDKHANYKTQEVCGDAGWGAFDNCQFPDGQYHTLDITAGYNLGQFWAPFRGAEGSAVYDRLTGNGHVEFYWLARSGFCGWSYYDPAGSGGCAGPYYESLTAYGF